LLLTACVLPEVSDATTGDSAAENGEAHMSSQMTVPEGVASAPSESAPAPRSGSAEALTDAGGLRDAHQQMRPEQSGSSASESADERFVCEGNQLLQCGPGASACLPLATCTSAILCDAQMGRCHQAACAPGSGICEGNVLLRCNADGTDYERESCGRSRQCNASRGRCDVCEPFSGECIDQRSRRVCRADGTAYEMQVCGGETPYCSGGRCVACLQHSDCPAIVCRNLDCRVGSCSKRAWPNDTPCVAPDGQAGTCSSGNCIANDAP
jgi:hypothetical protein